MQTAIPDSNSNKASKAKQSEPYQACNVVKRTCSVTQIFASFTFVFLCAFLLLKFSSELTCFPLSISPRHFPPLAIFPRQSRRFPATLHHSPPLFDILCFSLYPPPLNFSSELTCSPPLPKNRMSISNQDSNSKADRAKHSEPKQACSVVKSTCLVS